jgi:hypothetical protein
LLEKKWSPAVVIELVLTGPKEAMASATSVHMDETLQEDQSAETDFPAAF